MEEREPPQRRIERVEQDPRPVPGRAFASRVPGWRGIRRGDPRRFTGDDPNMKFYQRILDYLLVTSYSVFAVLVFDAVVDRLRAWRNRFDRSAA
jgi:hypothetical protein